MTHTYKVTEWNEQEDLISIRFDEKLTYAFHIKSYYNVATITDELVKLFAVLNFPKMLLTTTITPEQPEFPPATVLTGLSGAIVDITADLAVDRYKTTGLYTL
jgi:hypothetical protein